MKKWKSPLVGLFLILICFFIYFLFFHRIDPEITSSVHHPFQAKKLRPVRKNAVRSKRWKKKIAKNDHGIGAVRMTSSRCVKEDLDENTGILQQEVDSNCDGVVDRCRTVKLNAFGEPVHIEYYKDCGEKPNRCMDIDYNEYGEEIAYDYDSDCDGNSDDCLTFNRNDHGDEIETIYDKGCDGVLGKGEWHFCYTYDYNEDGLIISADTGNCGEEPDLCAEYEYDLTAGMKREKWDHDCDNTPDICWVKFSRDDSVVPESIVVAAPDEPDSFLDEGCDGVWKHCFILGEDGVKVHKFTGHEVCAKKYEELLKRNREKR